MTDPVTRIAGAPPPQPVQRRAPSEPSAASAATAAPATAPDAAAKAKPQPLAVDVMRSDGGVFVYTLRDPATDVVLAVIPRDAVRPGRDGRNVDQMA